MTTRLQLVHRRNRAQRWRLQLCRPYRELGVTHQGSVGCDVCTDRFVPGTVLDRVQDGVEVDLVTGQAVRAPRYVWRCPRHAQLVPHQLRELPSDVPGQVRTLLDTISTTGWASTSAENVMADLASAINAVSPRTSQGRVSAVVENGALVIRAGPTPIHRIVGKHATAMRRVQAGDLVALMAPVRPPGA